MSTALTLKADFADSFDLYSRTNQLLIDGGIFTVSLAAAWWLRFEQWPHGGEARQLLLWFPILIAGRLAVHYYRGVYRFVWRFVSLPDAIAIAESLSIITAGLIIIRLAFPGRGPEAMWAPLPLGVIAMEFLISLTGSMAARSIRRVFYESNRRRKAECPRPVSRVLLYGAGRAGILLLRELRSRRDVQVAGFVDDDPLKVGSVICGTPVLGSGKQLPDLRSRFAVDEVVISMASASRKTLMAIVAECRRIAIPAKIIPSLREIVERRANIGQLQTVHLEDFLGRESVRVQHLDEQALRCYRGKRILVTGGGGSIGSELVRQLVLSTPAAVAILDKDENSVYELQPELLLNGSECPLEPLIADVRNFGRLAMLFSEFRPDIVFHAAAHKHVPLMEKHPCEAILNNVVGTMNVIEASKQVAVNRFVFISTDKAVNPASIMGASKKVGELLVQELAGRGGLRAACVRFGNVLGSRGSIIPLFQKQIERGGPVTVTHQDMVRFFMTIPEAVQLILCAGTLADRGEVFILDMGSPRKILDLARELVLFSSPQTGKEIEISITGLRPGEKMSEELTTIAETLQPTSYPKLSMIHPAAVDQRAFRSHLEELIAAAKNNRRDCVYGALADMEIGFRSLCLKVAA